MAIKSGGWPPCAKGNDYDFTSSSLEYYHHNRNQKATAEDEVDNNSTGNGVRARSRFIDASARCYRTGRSRGMSSLASAFSRSRGLMYQTGMPSADFTLSNDSGVQLNGPDRSLDSYGLKGDATIFISSK